MVERCMYRLREHAPLKTRMGAKQFEVKAAIILADLALLTAVHVDPTHNKDKLELRLRYCR